MPPDYQKAKRILTKITRIIGLIELCIVLIGFFMFFNNHVLDFSFIPEAWLSNDIVGEVFSLIMMGAVFLAPVSLILGIITGSLIAVLGAISMGFFLLLAMALFAGA